MLTLLSLKGYIVQYSHVVDGILYHSLGISIYFITGISLFFVGNGIYLLIKEYRSSIDPLGRNKTAYLMTGWCILMLGGATNVITTPSVAGLPLDHIGSLLNVLIISYAISKFHLLDIKFVIRRGLAYFLIIGCLGGIYT
ncbi:MAG: diguanylate cyclase, partial [Dehalococcoidales bacterium]|nr:diguanylate cyclase [Dehalococcoidales bacterium]